MNIQFGARYVSDNYPMASNKAKELRAQGIHTSILGDTGAITNLPTVVLSDEGLAHRSVYNKLKARFEDGSKERQKLSTQFRTMDAIALDALVTKESAK